MGGVKPAPDEVVHDEAVIMEKDQPENLTEDFQLGNNESDSDNQSDWRRGPYPNRWSIPSSIL